MNYKSSDFGSHFGLISLLFLLLFSACQKEKVKDVLDLESLSIAEIHAKYSSGDLTAVELVEAYLARIDSVNPQINALTVINPKALEIAKALDEEFKSTGKFRPLHGIPMIVKDNINTLGLPTTAGSLALTDFYPEEDAFVIKKLEEAGAIVLAKSNMAEWAFSPMHSESSTAGITRNPYNLDFVPAGSSGGTGAGVAANLGTIGLGTDTGNSIRGPSSHNALVGFRSTLGLISREGIVPLYLRNDVVGPMCKTVEDATRVLQVMVGIDPNDPLTSYSEGKTETDYLQYLDKNGLKGARIGVFRTLSERDPDSGISVLFNQALKDLEGLGAVVIDSVAVPNFEELAKDQWCPTFKTDLEDFLQTYVKRDTMKTYEDMLRIGSKSEYTRTRLETLGKNTLRRGNPEIPCGNAYEDVRRIALREAIERTMDSLQLDALIYPSWNNRPARIDRFEEEYKGDNSQIISPHSGQPAFTVPMGFTEGNLPAGLQFLGRMYAEPTLIKLTYSYELGTKHRKAPKL
ncbi:Asp-tRNA(Asn)/Glu-tRNA(Gln) amidotransferase A subunit family amidase [Algoriphagus boseongensis]|uniref:Asp-tRNA(Asn)/Glu-tRNA(Gln) amidotransferase A subunit family amidase n=1 Tax=Algoriphagus boseongensis TaxID=1442587 RepID=A0A4R6T992_9BACT|nr:amidase family protein [Algoriphagus boseongensis]TDQ18809.1 Asp-tRNA(Asn)/Glu-tRNA(Gln) amidotransferase A subunit family amidase [Algoriphagus boseongensis]